MKKNIILLGALMISSIAYSQVGINNNDPKATLDVTAKTTDGTKPEGIIAPRLTGDQIKSADAQFGTAQTGTITYATSASSDAGVALAKTINITAAGYYYFDGAIWQKFSAGAAAGTDDWHLTGNTGTNGGTTITVPAAVSTNYVGTADANNFVVGVNGIARGVFTQQGSFIGGAGVTDVGALPAHAFGATPPTGSFVWGGGHKLAVSAGSGNYAAIFGNRNEVNSSNGFTTGAQNIIGIGSVASMVSGSLNNLGDQFQTSIVTGRSNTMNYNTAGGNGNIIAGESNTLTGAAAPKGAIVAGVSNTVTGTALNGIAVFGTGNNVNANMANATVLGKYNLPVDNSLFLVGYGTDAATQKNAVTVLNNGYVGVNTTPLTPAHFKLTDNSTATRVVGTGATNTTLKGLLVEQDITVEPTTSTYTPNLFTATFNNSTASIKSGSTVTIEALIPATSAATNLLPRALSLQLLNNKDLASGTVQGLVASVRNTGNLATGNIEGYSTSISSTNAINNMYGNIINFNNSGLVNGRFTGLEIATLANTGTMATTIGINLNSLTAGTQTVQPFSIRSSDANARMNHAGKVLIGDNTIVPTNQLHVTGGTNPVRFEGLQAGAATDAIVTADATGVLRTVTGASLASSLEPWQIQGGATKATTNTDNIYQQGSVAIGIASGASIPAAEVTANNPKLYVAGNVSSTGSFITTTSKYADYVFEDYFDGKSKINADYDFKSLAETAAYIKANKHLPGVTAIKDILKTENGYNVNLSELSIQQLEKIEELYLHTIDQQEEISKQKSEINDLKSRMEKLEQLLLKENNNK